MLKQSQYDRDELRYVPWRTAIFSPYVNAAEEELDWILDGGWLPQAVIRYGIRRQLRDRTLAIQTASLKESYQAKMQYVKALRTRPMAIETATANSQHYEVGTGILKACLGPRMKYSCCLYPTGKETLGHAEVQMLDSYVAKAELTDGMKILDLGCEKLVLDHAAMADSTNKVAVGDREHSTSLRYSQTPASQRSPIQERRKRILTIRPCQRDCQTSKSSLEMS